MVEEQQQTTEEEEELQYAQSKTGIRCMGETHWAEGTTKEEAYANWKAMKHRRTFTSVLLGRLLDRLPQPFEQKKSK